MLHHHRCQNFSAPFLKDWPCVLRQENPSICPHCPTEDRVASLIHMCAFLRFDRSSGRKDPCWLLLRGVLAWMDNRIENYRYRSERNFQFFREGEKRKEERERIGRNLRGKEIKRSIINNTKESREIFNHWSKIIRNSLIYNEEDILSIVNWIRVSDGTHRHEAT